MKPTRNSVVKDFLELRLQVGDLWRTTFASFITIWSFNSTGGELRGGEERRGGNEKREEKRKEEKTRGERRKERRREDAIIVQPRLENCLWPHPQT